MSGSGMTVDAYSRTARRGDRDNGAADPTCSAKSKEETAIIICNTGINEEEINMLPVKKIITTTDFSKPALSGVHTAVEMAQTFDAEVLLVHVMQRLQSVSGASTMAGYHFPSVEKEIREEVLQLADKLVTSEIPDSVRAKVHILQGTPAKEIAGLAEKEHADLIVIACRGDSTWKPVLFGSVAEGVVSHAQCPVLAVPAAEDESNSD
jgi:nucleotide-binding universal stress UspA family protein